MYITTFKGFTMNKEIKVLLNLFEMASIAYGMSDGKSTNELQQEKEKARANLIKAIDDLEHKLANYKFIVDNNPAISISDRFDAIRYQLKEETEKIKSEMVKNHNYYEEQKSLNKDLERIIKENKKALD